MHKTFFLILFLMCGVASNSYALEAPLLVTPISDGTEFNLTNLKGKVVIIHFWATWCVPCREEMPVLDNFYTQHHADGIEILAISVERDNARSKIKEYMQAFHMPYSMIGDATSNNFDTPRILPITYIIDTQGVVRSVLSADRQALSADVLDKTALPLLPR